MEFVPFNEVMQVELRFLQDSEKVENVFYVSRDDPGNPTVRQTVAEWFYQWWANAMAPLVSTTVNLREIYITDLTTQFSGTTSYVPAINTGGSNVNDPMPNNTTLCVSARTNARGRSYRGRSYFIGITRNVVVANTVTQAAVDAIQDAYNSLISEYIVQGQLVVASRVSEGVPRTVGVATPITNWVIVDRVVDSQRRRGPGRGQ